MKDFTYAQAADAQSAVDLISQRPNAKFLGGGTNLVDLMRENIEQPDALVDVTGLPFHAIEELPDGGVSIGAAARNTAVANHRLIRERYPFLSQAILSGASGQIRNMATIGGNLMQRTRCTYFYDDTARCNKRKPGSGCDAIGGFNRSHAILGTSEHCIATFPSDMCVPLVALDATVHVEGPNGERAIPFDEFHRLPGETPHIETELHPDELITSVQVPAVNVARTSMYRKVRDRRSYAFALVSVAVALETENGAIKHVRLALGGVAHKPWRALEAEKALAGKKISPDLLTAVATTALQGAKAYEHNKFKIELAKRSIIRALQTVAAIPA